jgi:segregation and condensation protein B
MSLPDQIEALLFVADQPATSKALAQALQVTEGQVEQGIEILESRLEERGSLRLTKLAGGYQLCTKPEFATLIATFLKPQRQRLSKSLLEVLAVVAYQQPITMAEIEQVRGVQSDYSVRALVERRLIQEVGRKPVPGRPVLYGTTQEFLHQFKINDLKELPTIDPDREDAADIVAKTLFDE